MDQAIQQFLQTGTLVLAFAVFIATFFVRRIVETAVPKLAKKSDENEKGATYESAFARWWNQVILYAIPVILGSVSGLINMPFIFGENIETTAGRCFFGAVVGWLSSFFYKVFRKLMVKHIDVEDDATLEFPE